MCVIKQDFADKKIIEYFIRSEKKAEELRSINSLRAKLAWQMCPNTKAVYGKLASKHPEMKEIFADGYLDLLQQIKALPSVIPAELFTKQCDIVKEACSEEAFTTFFSYGYRWNLKQE